MVLFREQCSNLEMFCFEISIYNLKWSLFRFCNCYTIEETVEKDSESMDSFGNIFPSVLKNV